MSIIIVSGSYTSQVCHHFIRRRRKDSKQQKEKKKKGVGWGWERGGGVGSGECGVAQQSENNLKTKI